MKPETTYQALLGKIIAQRRKSCGLGQDSVSKDSGINRSSLSRIENGEAAPDAIQLAMIAKTLNTTPEAIIKETGQMKEKLEAMGVAVHLAKKIPDSKKSGGFGWMLLGAALGMAITSIANSKDSDKPKNKKN